MTSCSHGVTEKSVTNVRSIGSTEFQYFYLEALRQENNGHYAEAFDLFLQCLAIDSMAPEAYYNLGGYYYNLNQDSLGQDCYRRAATLNPNNNDYQERLAETYLQSREYDKAIDAFETFYSKNRSRTDILDILYNLYQQNKDYKHMLSSLDRMEQVDGVNENITLTKMQVYNQMGDKTAAYNTLKGLSDEHPNDVNYKVMMGNWLVQNNRTDEARTIFDQALKEDPDNEYVEASLYDFYRQTGEDSLSAVYRDKILLNKYTATSTKATMVQQFIRDNEQDGGDSTVVLQLFQKLMDADPENADIAELNAIYKSLKKMPKDEINSAFYHVLKLAPDNASARLQILQNLWSEQKWDEIIELCKPALEYNPDEMAFCYYLGIAYFQKDDNDMALATFQHGVERINSNSNKDIASDMYAAMGDLLHEKGHDDEAYAAYDQCLQYNADNISCLNNYAYYLSINNGDLKKAESMSLKTINAEPNNTTYLDTYAWILYFEERYTEAQSFIDRAIENADSTANNSTIYDHAGDIYLACGDNTVAVEMWKKALDGSSEAEAIRKKIKKYEK